MTTKQDELQTVLLDEGAPGAAPADTSRRRFDSGASERPEAADMNAKNQITALQAQAANYEHLGTKRAQFWSIMGFLLASASYIAGTAGALIALALLFGDWPYLSRNEGLFAIFSLFIVLMLLRLAEKAGAVERVAVGRLAARMARNLNSLLGSTEQDGTDPLLVATYARQLLRYIGSILAPEPELELFVVKISS